MDIRKAILLSTQASGQALIPEDLDPVLIEYLYRIAPVIRRIGKSRADGKTHEINRRTAVPTSWFSGELGVLASAHSTYRRDTVQMKILRSPKGGVSGFERASARSYIDSLETEILGMVESMADLYEWSLLWGCTEETAVASMYHGFTGDDYQFTGLIPFIFNDVNAAANNVFDAAGGAVTLSDLDDGENAAEGFRGVARDPKVWLMSRQMRSRINGLETQIYRVPETVEFVGGWIMTAYKHNPIAASDFLSASQGGSPSLTGNVSDPVSGTGLAVGEYYYRMSSITRLGEQPAGAAGSASIAAATGDMALTWTADANAMSYMIWRGAVGGGSGAHADLSLIDIIVAQTYDTNGVVNGDVTTYTDNGRTRITTVHPLASDEQNIVLMNLNERRGAVLLYLPTDITEGVAVPAELRAEAGDLRALFGLVELARTRSSWDFQLEGYEALQVPWPRLHAMIRRVKYA